MSDNIMAVGAGAGEQTAGGGAGGGPPWGGVASATSAIGSAGASRVARAGNIAGSISASGAGIAAGAVASSTSADASGAGIAADAAGAVAYTASAASADVSSAASADDSAGATGATSTIEAARGNGLVAVIRNGLLDENPTFRLILGTCPTLAVTTSAINGVGMGLSAMIVLICSNVVISLIRKLIPDTVRIPAFVTVIAGFVTIVDLLLHAYVPSLYSALGIFIPLIVVNCIILARAEMFACKNSVMRSAADGLGMGLGFTAALLLIGSFRELLGNGTIFGITVTQSLFTPAALMLLPPGGFLAYGTILAIINKVTSRKTAVAGCDGCPVKCGLAGKASGRTADGAASGAQ